MWLREVAAGERGIGEAQDGDADRGRQQRERLVDADQRQGDRWQPGRDRSEDLHALAREVQERRRRQGHQHRRQRDRIRGNHRSPARIAARTRPPSTADGRLAVVWVNAIRAPQDRPGSTDRKSMPPRTVRNSGSASRPGSSGLAHGDVDADAGHVADEQRSGQESERNPRAARRIAMKTRRPTAQGRTPSGSGRRPRPRAGRWPPRPGRPWPRPGRREPARRPEHGISEERHERGIQAGLRWQAGDLGVADAERHDEGRDRSGRRSRPCRGRTADSRASSTRGAVRTGRPGAHARTRARRGDPRWTAGRVIASPWRSGGRGRARTASVTDLAGARVPAPGASWLRAELDPEVRSQRRSCR